jgi:hypothetical protein
MACTDVTFASLATNLRLICDVPFFWWRHILELVKFTRSAHPIEKLTTLLQHHISLFLYQPKWSNLPIILSISYCQSFPMSYILFVGPVTHLLVVLVVLLVKFKHTQTHNSNPKINFLLWIHKNWPELEYQNLLASTWIVKVNRYTGDYFHSFSQLGVVHSQG